MSPVDPLLQWSGGRLVGQANTENMSDEKAWNRVRLLSSGWWGRAQEETLQRVSSFHEPDDSASTGIKS